MSFHIRPIVLSLLCCCLGVISTGCSSITQTLGLSTPRYKLLETTENFRNNTGVPDVPRELMKTPLAAYILEPGDILLVQTLDLDSSVRLPADQPILPDGTIDLAQYGRPIVAGRTVPEVEAEVQQLVKAQAKEDVKINVRLIGRQSKVYYVLGEVNAPGSYPLSGRETVLDGIMAAGGLNESADLSKIILSRPTESHACRIVMPVCYSHIVQLGDTSSNYQLRPGDRIFIPSRSIFDGLFGRFRKQTSGPCCNIQIPCPPEGNCPPMQTATVIPPG